LLWFFNFFNIKINSCHELFLTSLGYSFRRESLEIKSFLLKG
jgi:hypothetical protein